MGRAASGRGSAERRGERLRGGDAPAGSRPRRRSRPRRPAATVTARPPARDDDPAEGPEHACRVRHGRRTDARHHGRDEARDDQHRPPPRTTATVPSPGRPAQTTGRGGADHRRDADPAGVERERAVQGPPVRDRRRASRRRARAGGARRRGTPAARRSPPPPSRRGAAENSTIHPALATRRRPATTRSPGARRAPTARAAPGARPARAPRDRSVPRWRRRPAAGTIGVEYAAETTPIGSPKRPEPPKAPTTSWAIAVRPARRPPGAWSGQGRGARRRGRSGTVPVTTRTSPTSDRAKPARVEHWTQPSARTTRGRTVTGTMRPGGPFAGRPAGSLPAALATVVALVLAGIVIAIVNGVSGVTTSAQCTVTAPPELPRPALDLERLARADGQRRDDRRGRAQARRPGPRDDHRARHRDPGVRAGQPERRRPRLRRALPAAPEPGVGHHGAADRHRHVDDEVLRRPARDARVGLDGRHRGGPAGPAQRLPGGLRRPRARGAHPRPGLARAGARRADLHRPRRLGPAAGDRGPPRELRARERPPLRDARPRRTGWAIASWLVAPLHPARPGPGDLRRADAGRRRRAPGRRPGPPTGCWRCTASARPERSPG